MQPPLGFAQRSQGGMATHTRHGDAHGVAIAHEVHLLDQAWQIRMHTYQIGRNPARPHSPVILQPLAYTHSGIKPGGKRAARVLP